jgi:hypothetical protein
MTGYRNKKYDIQSLITTIQNIALLAKHHERHINSIDINPIKVLENGCQVIDFKVLLKYS